MANLSCLRAAPRARVSLLQGASRWSGRCGWGWVRVDRGDDDALFLKVAAIYFVSLMICHGCSVLYTNKKKGLFDHILTARYYITPTCFAACQHVCVKWKQLQQACRLLSNFTIVTVSLLYCKAFIQLDSLLIQIWTKKTHVPLIFMFDVPFSVHNYI